MLLLTWLAWAPAARAAQDASQGSASDGSAPAPRVVVEEPVFDFGHVGANEARRHAFVLANQGTGPLRIFRTVGSCKCLDVRVSAEEVPPGGAAEVLVTFRGSAEADPNYSQRVRVETNDPVRDIVELVVRGHVGDHLVFSPPKFHVSEAPVGEPLTASLHVASTLWRSFEVSEPSSADLPGATWRLRRLTAEECEAERVVSGWMVTLEVPGEFVQKDFGGHATLMVHSPPPGESGAGENGSGEKDGEVKPAAEAKPRELRVPVTWETKRRLVLTGPGVDAASKQLRLGRIVTREGLKRQFLLKFTDKEPDLGEVTVKTTPEFVKARVSPYRRSSSSSLYRLELEVPPGALRSAYVEETAGKIELRFDHPRARELTLGLEMIPSG